MPRKIIDIEISEITLCKSPANRKKFFIKKMQEEAMLEQLKKFMAEDEEKSDDALTEEEIKKAEALPEETSKLLKPALEVVNEYKEDMPEDILGAIQTITKQAALEYPEIDEKDISKAGKKLSKSTRELIKKALSFLKDSPTGRQQAMELLNEMLGEKMEPTKKDVDGKENLSAETLTKLERLEELEDEEKARVKKAEDEKIKEAAKEKKDLLARLEALEEGKPIKKSIDDPGDDKDKKGKKKVQKGAGDEEDDDVDLYPSIPLLVPGGAFKD